MVPQIINIIQYVATAAQADEEIKPQRHKDTELHNVFVSLCLRGIKKVQ
jgi:hypothetical protein